MVLCPNTLFIRASVHVYVKAPLKLGKEYRKQYQKIDRTRRTEYTYILFSSKMKKKIQIGAAHKAHHAIFGQFWVWPPPPCHTLSHIPGPPRVRHKSRTPTFNRPSTKNPDKTPCTNSLSIVRGGFVRGSLVWKVLSGVVFVRSPFCQNTSVATES